MSLPTKQRIRHPAEFRRVFACGRRVSSEFVNVVVLTNDLPYPRVGLSVSKRVGGAVVRNLVKRRIRNSFAEMNLNSGWDIVVTARPQASEVSFTELDRAIKKSIERAGVNLTEIRESGVAI
ncbi:MAG: ribonuclease P protein component [Dehalococcoidia bacterium]|nr:ribonuclease P protein component [Chloroflexota bacterium]MDP6057087.1 ribonuclease P protein component [Dehalococcoidia bacterium]MDP7261964.1 ribonuclease P protein component [Dehalococcoidia bacterium]MDP7485088.1 ribonuclease P protein component [Dehalococcoidia bacterium]